jgi:hypothetical protein
MVSRRSHAGKRRFAAHGQISGQDGGSGGQRGLREKRWSAFDVSDVGFAVSAQQIIARGWSRQFDAVAPLVAQCLHHADKPTRFGRIVVLVVGIREAVECFVKNDAHDQIDSQKKRTSYPPAGGVVIIARKGAANNDPENG